MYTGQHPSSLSKDEINACIKAKRKNVTFLVTYGLLVYFAIMLAARRSTGRNCRFWCRCLVKLTSFRCGNRLSKWLGRWGNILTQWRNGEGTVWKRWIWRRMIWRLLSDTNYSNFTPNSPHSSSWSGSRRRNMNWIRRGGVHPNNRVGRYWSRMCFRIIINLSLSL